MCPPHLLRLSAVGAPTYSRHINHHLAIHSRIAAHLRRTVASISFRPPIQTVVARTTLQAVIPTLTIKRVVAAVADQDIAQGVAG